MIPKSMSRKTASFDQLSAYMDSEKSDQRFDLHHNCYARGQKNIAAEFYENSKHLKSRKNGNILYHDIISISLEEGVERGHAKECLRDITLKYIETRCPQNMVYGCLHEDHADHLHYHLMISANQRGDTKRHWLTKSEFKVLKEDLEKHVLENYQQLKQRKINTATKKEKQVSRKAADQKRRTGKLDRQEKVRMTILKAMVHTSTMDEFKSKLLAEKYEYYSRGKNHGVSVAHTDGKKIKYRFSTIGVHEEFEEYLGVLQTLHEAQEKPQEAKEQPTKQEPKQEDEAAQKTAQEPKQEESFEDPFEAEEKEHQSTKTPTQEKTNDDDYEFLRELEHRAKKRADKKREKALKQNQRKGKPKGRSR